MVRKTIMSKTYLELISTNKKEEEKQELGFRAEEAAMEVAGAILETKKSLATKRRELTNAKKAIPYVLQTEIDLTVEVETLEQGLEVAQNIQKERFPSS